MSSAGEKSQFLYRIDELRDDISCDWLKNANRKIEDLEAENEDLRHLNSNKIKTIRNLEHELQNYRNQSCNHNRNNLNESANSNYTNIIKALENTIKEQNNEIGRQAEELRATIEHCKLISKRAEELEWSLKEKECQQQEQQQQEKTGDSAKVQQLKCKLMELSRQNRDLEMSLNTSNKIVEERTCREHNALQKVEEVLKLASDAIAEKEKAQRHEKLIREECESLASTIGGVMDDAAKKVEKDMEEMRNKFADRERALTDIQTKLTEKLRDQLKCYQIQETRNKRLEEKLQKCTEKNAALKKELRLNTQLIEEYKLKLQKQEKFTLENEKMRKCVDSQLTTIQQYVQSNKELKQKHKATVVELTNQFEKAIVALQKENAELKAKNHRWVGCLEGVLASNEEK